MLPRPARSRATQRPLAAAVASHPDRYAGLAAAAPQDPRALRRRSSVACAGLGLRGVILNSHTHSETWTTRSSAPYRGLRGARRPGLPAAEYPIEGDDRAVRRGRTRRRDLWLWRRDRPASAQDHRRQRTSTASGLCIVVGHCGEALPFSLFRLDYMRRATIASRRLPVHEAAAATTTITCANVYVEQRCGLGAGDHVLPFSARRRPCDVCDGLSVPLRPRRGPGERWPAAYPGGKERVLPGQRRARVSPRREAGLADTCIDDRATAFRLHTASSAACSAGANILPAARSFGERARRSRSDAAIIRSGRTPYRG